MNTLWKWLGQRPRLEQWESRPFAPGVGQGPGPRGHRDNHEREVAAERPGGPEPGGPYERLAEAIFSFRVFPPRLVTPVLRRTPVEVGDTVGVCYHLLWGVDLFFAARVTDRFDETTGGVRRTGFAYRTLLGHPETGEETFCVEKDLATGRVRVALRSWSRPGILLTRLLGPVTRRFQLRAGRAALEHLARVAREPAPPAAPAAAGRIAAGRQTAYDRGIASRPGR
jgi:uncharacterized protein (UPF0548 family)